MNIGEAPTATRDLVAAVSSELTPTERRIAEAVLAEPEIALAKVDKEARLDVVCTLACGAATGLGAAMYKAKVEPGSRVVVFGLGGIGLNVIQGLRLAGADQIVGVDTLPPTAEKMRRLMHYGQMFQSHSLHFFHLASPDLLFGFDADVAQRNVLGVAAAHPELARQGILMRKYGQEIIKMTAGKKIHGITAIPGGVHKTFFPEERDYFLVDNETPSVDTMIEWSKGVVNFIKDYHDKNFAWLDKFASYPSGHLGLVGKDGALEMYDGRMRAIDAEGKIQPTPAVVVSGSPM